MESNARKNSLHKIFSASPKARMLKVDVTIYTMKNDQHISPLLFTLNIVVANKMLRIEFIRFRTLFIPAIITIIVHSGTGLCVCAHTGIF